MLVLLKVSDAHILSAFVNELLWEADACCEEIEAIGFGSDREFLSLIDRDRLIQFFLILWRFWS